ncbi:MAG TPA: protein kinase [Terriglobales bacterium]|nr:protein kinase [Terriglobales bacterium]
MALAPGSKLGPYEIVAPLGAGGMGEVYRAKDTRLNREVAVKILSTTGGFSSDLKQRFEREAKAISALNHPHICTLHDIGNHEGTDFLVMELLEGQTLADRLERGPLPLEQSLTIGEQIADALERAHRKGIVHRDLKPGNIVLTKSGAKLLDFGLAKPVAHHMAATMEATRSQPITAEGAIVGTYQYMAPEQIEGKEADARTDIFALGAVLYEMATGKKAFEGKSQISVASAILERDPPPISAVQAVSPPELDRVVATCLAKDPERRWQSAQDVKLELGFVRAAGSAPSSVPGGRRMWPWAAVGAALLLSVVAGTWWLARGRTPEAAGALYRASLLPPRDHSFVAYDFLISPDGSKLAFTATSADGVTTLWLKDLSSDSNQEFAGTEGASFPFWSPDSRYIAFFAGGRLLKVDTRTGATQPLASAIAARGGAWGPDGTILYVDMSATGLARVSANGGAVSAATVLPAGAGESHRWPTFLPDGKHFLFMIDWSARDGLYMASLDDPTPVLVARGIWGNTAFADGKVFYVRDGTLYAQTFDLAKHRLSGEPEPLVNQELEQDSGFSRSGFSIANNRTLVYQSRRSYSSRLVWFDRSGQELEAVGPPGPYHPTLSPDGRQVALTRDSGSDGHMRVHTLDLARGTVTLIAGDSQRNEAPVWSPDGKRIAYATYGEGSQLIVRAADGTGSPKVIMESQRMMTNSWSRDGRYLVFMNMVRGFPELWAFDLAENKAIDLQVQGAEGQISPNGRWLAYTLGRGTSPQTYIRPFPGNGGRLQVSPGGGTQSRWSPDGSELFYVNEDKRLMAVSVREKGGTLELSTPRPLFRTRMRASRFALFQYDVSPDGKRFLINSIPREDAAAPLTLVTDWTQLGK